jgi:hypothetical protein
MKTIEYLVMVIKVENYEGVITYPTPSKHISFPSYEEAESHILQSSYILEAYIQKIFKEG